MKNDYGKYIINKMKIDLSEAMRQAVLERNRKYGKEWLKENARRAAKARWAKKPRKSKKESIDKRKA